VCVKNSTVRLTS